MAGLEKRPAQSELFIAVSSCSIFLNYTIMMVVFCNRGDKMMLAFYLALIDDESSRLLFEELYLAHRHTMVCAANRILNDQMLAEDATHDAFMRILNHLEKISDPWCNKTRNFVVLIVKNIALDYVRKMKRKPETSFDADENAYSDQQNNPEEEFLEKETRDNIKQDIANLHPNYALVLSMKYSLGYEDKEIAEILKISYDKVRLQLHRARKQLKKSYKQDGV